MAKNMRGRNEKEKFHFLVELLMRWRKWDVLSFSLSFFFLSPTLCFFEISDSLMSEKMEKKRNTTFGNITNEREREDEMREKMEREGERENEMREWDACNIFILDLSWLNLTMNLTFPFPLFFFFYPFRFLSFSLSILLIRYSPTGIQFSYYFGWWWDGEKQILLFLSFWEYVYLTSSRKQKEILSKGTQR